MKTQSDAAHLFEELGFIREICDSFISGRSLNQIARANGISGKCVSQYLDMGLRSGFMRCLSPKEKQRMVNWRLRADDSITEMIEHLGISEGELRYILGQISISATRSGVKLNPPSKEFRKILEDEEKQAREWLRARKDELKDFEDCDNPESPRVRGRRIGRVSIDEQVGGGTIGDRFGFAPARSPFDERYAEHLQEEREQLRDSLEMVRSLRRDLTRTAGQAERTSLREEIREYGARAREAYLEISRAEQNHEYYQKQREGWLTKTETRVLDLLRSGRTQSQIKDEMKITKQAVSKHVKKIRFKMGPFVEGLFVEANFGRPSAESGLKKSA